MADVQPSLLLDLPAVTEHPRHFRSCLGSLVRPHEDPVPLAGLRSLRVSGSAQPDLNDILSVKQLAERVTLVDLRQESHGFADATPVSWYVAKNWINVGKSQAEVLADETRRLADLQGSAVRALQPLAKDLEGNITESTSHELQVASTATEAQLAAAHGLGYIRFFVPDHCRPSDDEARRFVAFYRSLEPGVWLHLHCHGGDGRTTTFMLMCDILQNGRKLSLEQFNRRQYLIGGADLLNHPSLGYKTALYAERIEFVREFYAAFAD